MLFIVSHIKSVLATFHLSTQYFNMLDSWLILNQLTGSLRNATAPQSVYFLEKYEQPVHLILHSQRSNPTLGLYQPFKVPIFMNKHLPDLKQFRHPTKPNLRLPLVNSPWVNNDYQMY